VLWKRTKFFFSPVGAPYFWVSLASRVFLCPFVRSCAAAATFFASYKFTPTFRQAFLSILSSARARKSREVRPKKKYLSVHSAKVVE
jgi:hypothetical protein